MFEPWNPESDRWGLFAYQRRLYVIPLHPFANICDGHRAEQVQWSPTARGVDGFIAQDALGLQPVAGPFRTKTLALKRADTIELKQRFWKISGPSGNSG